MADLLFLQIYPLKLFSNIACIRTARRGVPSCHLKHGHVVLIQFSSYQPDRSAVSQDIHIQFFFQNRLYQVNGSTGIPSCHLFHGHVLLIQCSKSQPNRSAVSHRHTQRKFFSKIVCIRRSHGRKVSSCSLYHGQVLLLQDLKVQEDKLICSQDIPTQSFFENRLYQEIIWTEGLAVPSLPWACPLCHWHALLILDFKVQEDKLICSEDIPTQNFFEIRLYQENRSTGCPVVPPFPWTCSSGTMFEISVSQICCLLRYTHNFSSKIGCNRSSGRKVSSCPLYYGHVLLIQDFKVQEDKLICSQDIPT